MAEAFYNLPNLPTGYQGQHVIPQQLWPTNTTLQTLEAAGRITSLAGQPPPNVISLQDFTFNGLGLPSDVVEAARTGLSVHLGSHPQYSTFIESLLNEALVGIQNP